MMDIATILQPAASQPPETIKACCAALYDSEWVTMLLGDSYHPGRLQLTERLGELLELEPGQKVLDVASGKGASALFLAERFGCQVVGLDFAQEIVREANQAAAEAGLAGQVHFEHGDAEQLPFEPETFDAILCECAFCTFPSKPAAAREFARVLRPGGRIGISDLTKSGTFPEELETLMAWVACVADALPVEDYTAILKEAGLNIHQIEAHDKALVDLVDEVRGKLLGVELMVKLKKIALPIAVDFDEAGRLAKITADAVQQGKLGYALLIGGN